VNIDTDFCEILDFREDWRSMFGNVSCGWGFTGGGLFLCCGDTGRGGISGDFILGDVCCEDEVRSGGFTNLLDGDLLDGLLGVGETDLRGTDDQLSVKLVLILNKIIYE
jgi:hypothetical protein